MMLALSAVGVRTADGAVKAEAEAARARMAYVMLGRGILRHRTHTQGRVYI